MVPIVPAAGFDEAAILRLAASVERSSEHPLADATVRAAGEWNLKLADVEEFDSPTGKGVIGTVDGKAALLGNAQSIVSSGIRTQSLEEQAEELRMPPANASASLCHRAGASQVLYPPKKATGLVRRIRTAIVGARADIKNDSAQHSQGCGRSQFQRFAHATVSLLISIAAGAQRAWPLVELL